MKNLVNIFLGLTAIIFLTSTGAWACWGRDRGMGGCAPMRGQQTNMMDKGQNPGDIQGQSQQKEYSEKSAKEEQQKGTASSDCCALP